MSSRNAAIEFMKIAFEQGALSLPQKKADKFDALAIMVDDITGQFYWDTMEAPNRTKEDNTKYESTSNGEDFD